MQVALIKQLARRRAFLPSPFLHLATYVCNALRPEGKADIISDACKGLFHWALNDLDHFGDGDILGQYRDRPLAAVIEKSRFRA